ncbi:MAG: hypothetical protein DI534_09090 [Leifsonia xyli]|nr:MAG: hypothetical protein DI534_09090 [Leifsonia xyli]
MPTRASSALRLAARDVDPMSWFTGPYVPLVFSVFIALYGGLGVTLTWNQSQQPGLQLAGVALCAAACLVLQVLTSLRNRLDWPLAAVVVVMGGAGLLVSAVGFSESTFAIEPWWAPFCFALALSSLAPYLATWHLLSWGLLSLVTIVPATFVIIAPAVPDWGPVSLFLLIAYPPAVAVATTAAFSSSVVQQMLPIVDNRSHEVVSEVFEPDPEDEDAERATLAQYTARAVPFLRTIAERGTVTASDRALAGEIARYLRDDLVSRTDLAWLGLRAEDTRVVVVDPEHRVQSMRAGQRAAIRDLVRAVLDEPSTDATTIYMELRPQSDGSTAVAMTLDADLPEGRRVRHIAPYYFNLRGAMRDVKLGRDRLSFRVPPAGSPR